MGWLADSPQRSSQREFEAAADDEARAAMSLLWAASGWLEVDKLLELVAPAARAMGWSHVIITERASALCYQPRRSTGHESRISSSRTRCMREWYATVGSTCAGRM